MLFQKLKKMRAKYERARKRMLEAEAVEREEKRKAEEARQKQKEEEAKAKALEQEEGSSGDGRWQKRTLGNSSSGNVLSGSIGVEEFQTALDEKCSRDEMVNHVKKEMIRMNQEIGQIQKAFESSSLIETDKRIENFG